MRELRTRRLRILVADDLVDFAETLAMLLEAEGHEVAIAFDGLTAVELAKTCPLDVVILDIGLPELEGYEAARRIRACKGAELKLIAITAWGREEDKKRAVSAGFDQHFTKPPDFQSLIKLLREFARLRDEKSSMLEPIAFPSSTAQSG